MKRDMRLYIDEYFGVNIDRTWKAIIDDIPDLKEKIQIIKNDLEG